MEKYDKVTDEQLIKDFRNGDREIMDHLMMKYKAMVRKKARAMYLFGGENEDLIQEGMIGLIKAVRDYDPDQGASFADVFRNRGIKKKKAHTVKFICIAV